MNTYFKFKLVTEYLIPLVIIGLIVVILTIRCVLDCIRISRINKHFESHGYERKLLGVASFGGVDFYGWRKESDGKVTIADDRELKSMSVREIKEAYK
ncbi:MAG: hypothetical protein J6B01_04915 [Ruminococcus sp.]|nr:hypothetical protein [Ruminococcus sp.]MBO5319133.1 hypothetical protein [Ruminococcus sp.]